MVNPIQPITPPPSKFANSSSISATPNSTANKPESVSNNNTQANASSSVGKQTTAQPSANEASGRTSSQVPTQKVAQSTNISVEQLTKQLKQGSITATVSRSQALSPLEQQQLNKVNPALTKQLAQAAPASNPNSKQALSTQNLYLIKLTHQQQTLNTITPTPLKVGDSVQLNLNSQGGISVTPNAAALRPTLIQALRQVLPQQVSTSQLLSTATKIESLPPSLKSTLLSQPVSQAVSQLTQFTQSTETLQTAAAVKNVLTQSGAVFENKLQANLPIAGDLRTTLSALLQAISKDFPHSNLGNAQAASPSFGNKALDLILGQLLSAQNISAATTTATQSSAKEANQPLLGGLLQLLGIKVSNNPKEQMQSLKEAISQQLGKLAQGTQEKIQLNQLRGFTQEGGSSEGGSRPLSLHTEIPLRWGDQILPLQVSIEEQWKQKQQGSGSGSEEEGKEGNADNEKKMERRWQVFLAFDLPASFNKPSASKTYTTETPSGFSNKTGYAVNTSTNTPAKVEQLFAQLTVIDQAVSATVWSESSSLCNKAKEQLQQLRQRFIANGLTVDDLHCVQGKPPSKELSLDYNLINIST